MLITNGTVVTWGESNEVLPDYAVLIEGENITALGPSRELAERYPQGRPQQRIARGRPSLCARALLRSAARLFPRENSPAD